MVVSGEKHPYPDGLTEAEYSDIISSFYEKHGVSIKGTRDIRDEYFGTFLCSSRAKNVFIIDSLGDLYNCVSLTGNKKYSLGNINGGFDFISKKMEEHMKRTFTSSCRKCKFLPICYGGCRLERITGEHNNGCLKDHFNYILPRVLEWKIAERSE
ncbi:MAG: SPASM domain-containing protein [Candidatus Cloacimonetes bacterium]|nr:SPASM domain-containing protein [Candidatus Cloacimonadota bacterium]